VMSMSVFPPFAYLRNYTSHFTKAIFMCMAVPCGLVLALLWRRFDTFILWKRHALSVLCMTSSFADNRTYRLVHRGQHRPLRQQCWCESVCTTQRNVTWPTSMCRRKSAAIIHIHHRHCYYYSALKLILILPSHQCRINHVADVANATGLRPQGGLRK